MSPDKLTIIHVNTEKSLRGGELQMLRLAEELQARGHKNHLILQKDSPIIEEARERNLHFEQVKMRGEWDLLAGRTLRKAMNGLRPEILHAHTSHAGSIALIARRFDATPAVVLSRRVSLPLKKNFFTLYKYRAVNAVLTVSPVIAKILLESKLSEDRVFVAESGTDFSRFEKPIPREQMRSTLEIPPQAFVVGNVGHFDKAKGQLLLIQTFAQLVRRNPSVQYYLLLVGEGPTREECRRFAAQLNLSERVLFPGYRKDVENYYPVMDLFFHPSLPIGIEGWSGVIREAMACSIPVIAIRQPSLEEQIRDGETGLLVSFQQLNEWIGAIEKLRNDPELRKKLSSRARDFVKEFTIQRLADKTEKCYRAVLENQMLREKPL